MGLELLVIFVLSLVNLTAARESMEGRIVGGKSSRIEDFPYTALLALECHSHDGVHHFVCGASIVNQVILLTAAHCVHGCNSYSIIDVYVGSVLRKKGTLMSVSKLYVHEKYSSTKMKNDIALLMLNNNMKFGKTVRRVSLMKHPPYHETSFVAGWGMTDEHVSKSSIVLRHTSQEVWSRNRCQRELSWAASGALCVGVERDAGYAAKGDSGGALVVRQYIQIGLVSFKSSSISKTIIVYTDIGYFYDWIRKHSKNIYCFK